MKYQFPEKVLSNVAKENRQATRRELELIFQRNIAQQPLPDHVLKYFKDYELKRLIILEVYRINVIIGGKNRLRMIHILSTLTGCHLNSVNRWIIRQFGTPKDQSHGKAFNQA